jgi:hypothetical protein
MESGNEDTFSIRQSQKFLADFSHEKLLIFASIATSMRLFFLVG